MLSDWTFLTGYAIACLTAMLVILVDCRNTLKKLAPCLNALSFWGAWLLACGCGAIAAFCYHCSKEQWLTQQIVDLKIGNAPLRGLLIGLAVLTIIRSKIANQKDQPIGGEYLYNWGRTWVIERMWSQWFERKSMFIKEDLLIQMCGYPNVDDLVFSSLENRLASRPDDQAALKAQKENILKTRPSTDPGSCSREWKDHYRRVVSLTLDFGGERIITGLVGAPDLK